MKPYLIDNINAINLDLVTDFYIAGSSIKFSLIEEYTATKKFPTEREAILEFNRIVAQYGKED